MDRDKQIEEMARVWCPFSERHDCCGCSKGCYEISKSELLYNAGYRKASEIFEEIELLLDLNALHGDVFTGRYFSEEIEADIAELKKKYTEEKGWTVL